MNYLIDTHIFLWTVFYSKKLSKRIKNILLDPEAIIHASVITFWEISLKYQLGKINLVGILPDKLPMIAKKSGFEILNLDVDTISSFYKLPKLKNKDPFDRMLAWQAICQDYHFLTQDQDFADYKNHGLKIV